MTVGKLLTGGVLTIALCVVILTSRQTFRPSIPSRSEAVKISPNSEACTIALAPQTVRVPGGVIHVSFAAGELDLPQKMVVSWVKRAAVAVSIYYGRFPLTQTRLRIVPVEGEEGIYSGKTFAQNGTVTLIPLGQHTTARELDDDWTLTHEFVHLAFPDLPTEHRWVEEGLATYVEPIARVQAGQLKSSRVWRDLIRDMPKGQPGPGDQGLDRTHTWARTYWGGALYCLRADLMIRQLTQNRYGLQDALRAIVTAGGTQDKHDWSLARALKIGDQATGTEVLEQLYAEMKSTPVQVDLDAIWRKLGISSREGKLTFSSDAEFAIAREAITRISAENMVLALESETQEAVSSAEEEEETDGSPSP